MTKEEYKAEIEKFMEAVPVSINEIRRALIELCMEEREDGNRECAEVPSAVNSYLEAD